MSSTPVSSGTPVVPLRASAIATERDADAIGGERVYADLVRQQLALLGDPLQHGEVDDVAGPRVHLAADGDVERVVVTVPVRVVALAEEPLVLLVRERGVVHAVRRIELQTASHGDDRHAGRR